jgi:hypothetical protein
MAVVATTTSKVFAGFRRFRREPLEAENTEKHGVFRHFPSVQQQLEVRCSIQLSYGRRTIVRRRHGVPATHLKRSGERDGGKARVTSRPRLVER